MVDTLDALAFASLPEDAQIAKLAARFRETHNFVRWSDTALSELDLRAWVVVTFGPLFRLEDEVEERRLSHRLLAELRRQTQIAQGRKARAPTAAEPSSVPARRARLVRQILGPPSKYLSIHLHRNKHNAYTESLISQGLVLALITGNELAGHASVLVFRAPGAQRTQSYWVGTRDTGAACRNLNDALEWLTTPAVSQLAARGLRVEREWHKTRFRVYHPDGRTSTLPWRRRT